MKTILVDAWNTLFTERGVFQQMKDMLDTFPNRKIVVSNANKDEMVKFGIDKSPYEVFTLEHNPNKTDPRFFKILLEKQNLHPGQVIYFEHNKEAVRSAESIGVKAYWYDKDTKDLAKLREFIENA